MKCTRVQKQLAGYLDGAVRPSERTRVQEHLELCGACRGELERYRKLSSLLSRATPAAPPPGLVAKIRVAAAQARAAQVAPGRLRAWWEHVAVRLENVYRPLAVPATGGIFSAMLVFAVVLQLIVPGITVRAVQNDVPTNLLRPAALLSLSEYPLSFSPDRELDLALPHGLLVDVTVDDQGQMMDYQILSGPNEPLVRRQLAQALTFARFRPMMSFGRAVSGGHVVLSFSEIQVKG